MKRILSIALILALCLCFAGCKQDKGRELYNVNLEKYVKLGEYKGITIDTASDDFLKTNDSIIANDVANYDLYVINKEGTVKMGDTVNIDYVGKKDGVAFDGGTAEGYDLTIGSGAFIEGFEDGLLDKEIGSTVDLNLTFPENYGNEELNGADVVFTVKINYAKTTTAREPEDFYKDLGFGTVDEYYANVKQRAIEQTYTQIIIDNSEIKDYPKADLAILSDYYYDIYEDNIKYQYQIELSDYLSYINQTEEQFKEDLNTNVVKPYMEMQMLWYAIFDKEEMSLAEDDINNKIKEIIVQSGDTSATESDVIENYGKHYVESLVVSDKVFEFIEKNAVIS